MPLDDQEQRILAEIERRFYEEDPDLARAVRDIDRARRLGVRLPLVGVILGAIVVLATFTINVWIASVAFVVLVASTTALVQGLKARVKTDSESRERPRWWLHRGE